jgi:hypothetical protein
MEVFFLSARLPRTPVPARANRREGLARLRCRMGMSHHHGSGVLVAKRGLEAGLLDQGAEDWIGQKDGFCRREQEQIGN